MNGASKKEEDLPTSNRFLFNINAEDSIKRSTTLLESILGKTLNRLKTNSYFPKKNQETGAQSLNLPQEGQGEGKMGFQTIKVSPKGHVGSPKPTADTTEVHAQSKTERASTQKDTHRRPTGLKTESLNHSYSKYGAKNDKITEVFDLRVIKVPQADDDSMSRDDSDALGTLSKNLKFKPMLEEGPGGRQLPENHENFKNMDYRRSMTENQPAKSPRQGNNRVIGLNKGRMHPGEFSVVANQVQETEASKQRGLLQAPGNSSFGDLMPRDDAQRDSMQRSDLSMSQISKLSQTKNNTTERTGLPDRDFNRDSVDLYTNSVGGLPSTESRTRVASTSISSSLKPESEQLPRLSSKNKSASPKLDAIEEKPEPAVSPASSRPGPGQLASSDMSDRGKESKIHISDCRAQEDTSVKKLQSEPELGASPLRQPSSTSSHTRREVSAAGKKGILVNKDRMNAPSDLISVPDFSNVSRGLHQTSQQTSGKKTADDRVRFSDKPTVWLVQSYKTHMKGEDGTSCCERCNLI